MGDNDVVHETETEPRALADILCGEKRLEDSLEIFFGDPAAAVGNRHFDPIARLACRESDHAFTVDRVEEHERGEALGSFTAFNDIGSGGGAYLIGAIADAAGFGAAYATPAVLCAAGAVLLAVMGRRPVPVPADR